MNKEILVPRVHFTDIEQAQSQQTFASFLKKHEYYFRPITEYDNNLFYCMVRVEKKKSIQSFMDKILKTKLDEYEYHDCKLKLHITDGTDVDIDEPFIFNREDILKILNDAPGTYIGEDVL